MTANPTSPEPPIAVGLLAAMLLFLSAGHLAARPNGEIAAQHPIADFAGLLEYISQAEDREAPELDPSRYRDLPEVELHGITYWSDGLRVKGFLLKPKTAGPFPALIYNRGGSLEHGSLTHPAASVQLGELATIARAGFVIAASQYRGNGGGEGQEEYMGSDLQDVLSLFDLLASQPEVDPGRVGMLGWSRGGATTFRCLTKSNKIKAAAVGGPAVNYLRIIEEEPEMGEYWSEFVPGYHDDPQGVMRERSVLFWVDRLPTDVPVLIVHGAADPKVASRDILSLAMEMDAHQVPYRLVVFEGGDHGLTAHRKEALAQIIGWFDRFL